MVLAIPYAVDQHMNAAYIQTRALGEKEVLGELDTEKLISTINKIISDPKYKQNVMKLSRIFREYKASGTPDAAFWVEHVIKHGGAHLRAHAYNLPSYKYLMLDVIAFLFCCAFSLSVVVWKTCHCVYHRCLRRTAKVKSE